MVQPAGYDKLLPTGANTAAVALHTCTHPSCCPCPVLPAGVISALPKIITTGFKAIQLIYFFTAGEDEVKCWQIRKYSKAPQAAGAQAALIAACWWLLVAGMIAIWYCVHGAQGQAVEAAAAMLLHSGQAHYLPHGTTAPAQ
jgi:hypothetical protein